MMAKEFEQKRWHTMTLAEQLGNIGSDFERALRWKEKSNQQLFTGSANRTLEQLDMTLADDRHHGHRRREIARVREAVCGELFSEQSNSASAAGLTRYFLSMATLARHTKIL